MPEYPPPQVNLGLDLRPEMRQLPVAVLCQLMALVPVPAAEIDRAVQQALEVNPCLVRAEGWPCAGCGRHLRGRRCPTCATVLRSAMEPSTDQAGDWRSPLVNDVCLELAGVSREAVERVLSHLDSRGLLADEADVAAHSAGVDRATADVILDTARLVGPPGMAACSVQDSIRRQCEALIAAGRAPALLIAIVDEHLESVASDELQAVAEALGCSPAAVTEAVTILRSQVRPYPVLDGPPAAPVQPDLVIRWRHGDGDRHGPLSAGTNREGVSNLVVEVADARWYGLRIETDRADSSRWSAPHVQAAQDLLRQIELRASLLRRIGEDLVAHQATFLLEGHSHRSLRRADVAARLGVHPSTVGRAVARKWVRCPSGRLVPLASFFGAATGPMDVLRRLLADHPASSDRALAALLAEQGHPVARRTVAKYRSALLVPARHPKFGSPPRS